MGVKNNFKWVRSLPQVKQPGDSGFYSFNLKAMRQIPTSIHSAAGDGHITPIVKAFIPKSSWAQGKVLMIRCWYRLLLTSPSMPPFYSINEGYTVTGGGPGFFIVPPAFVPFNGTYTTWIERYFIRQDPVIFALEHGDVLQHNWANDFDSERHVIEINPTGPSFDFNAPMELDLVVQMDNTLPASTLTAVFAETFLEQATNLGRLP